MQPSSMHYFPLAWPFLLGLFFVLIAVVALIELHILKFAYERMGVPPRYVLGILLLSLVGSAINVPIAELPPEKFVADRYVDFYGVRYVIPVIEVWPHTIVAANIGGAVIPVILSAYLLIKNKLYVRGIAAIAIVAMAVYPLSQPVRGVGISVPMLIPRLLRYAPRCCWHGSGRLHSHISPEASAP